MSAHKKGRCTIAKHFHVKHRVPFCDKSRLKCLLRIADEAGFFIFNCFCTEGYPNEPPKVDIVTNGGGGTRCGHGPGGFNPNLYPEGKVCLSLLGSE